MVRTQVLKHLPGAREGNSGGSKGNFKREAMEKGGCVRVMEGEEIRGDDPVEYFLPLGVGNTS